MKAVMIANTIIKLGWIAATVFLVVHGENWWAVATFIGAFVSDYSHVRRAENKGDPDVKRG